MDLPERAPSRQTGAICIRHYDEGRNPYCVVDAASEAPVVRPLASCKFKERFLLKHIADARATDARKRGLPAPEVSPAVLAQTSGSSDVPVVDQSDDASGALGAGCTQHRSHVAILQARLDHLDEELYGPPAQPSCSIESLDASMFLEWELQCARFAASGGWRDAVVSETDVTLCNFTIPCELIGLLIEENGDVPLFPLLKGVYPALTDDALDHLARAAERARPVPLVFANSRSLHRYFAEVVKQFSKSMKSSRRSGKVGLDRAEFISFCRTVKVFGEYEAIRVFDKASVEAANSSVGRVFTVDEFASLYSL